MVTKKKRVKKKDKKGKGGKPDFLDLDKDGDKKEPMKKASKEMKEGAGLYANIHAKRKRGGKMRKKGAEGAPSAKDFANAAKTAKEDVDMFDAILNHYVSEGYDADDVIQAMSSLTEEQLQNIDEALPLALAGALKTVTGIAAKKGITGAAIKTGAKKLAKSSLASDMARGAAMQAGSNIVSGGGGGNQSNATNKTGRRTTQYTSADLFDIVKGQLLDEGLSEEEIKDIMLELTPEEILAEMDTNYPAGKGANYQEKPKVPEKKKLGGRTDGTAGSYVEKPQPKPQPKPNM